MNDALLQKPSSLVEHRQPRSSGKFDPGVTTLQLVAWRRLNDEAAEKFLRGSIPF